MQALILAGGKGTRLMPYTSNLPKPLMPIDDIPILEILIRQLQSYGITSIIIAVGYLNHMIEEYFEDGTEFGVSIKYSLEKNPLGTAGPIGLVFDDLEDNFLVLNGDLLTTINFKNIFEAHLNEKSAATIATFSRRVDIDFGVLQLSDKSELVSYTEKPSYNYKVSMGINVLNKKSLEGLIVRHAYLDIPKLMLLLKDSGKKVFCYEEDCKWLDIGRVDDYQEAVKNFSKNKKVFLPNS
jgi:NDP-mannose synthase